MSTPSMVSSDTGTGIGQLFRRQAAKTPAATALIDDGKEISFHELDLLKNQIAAFLLQHRCRPGDRVGVKLENTRYMVATLLAVNSIGCIYIPFDHETPVARVSYIMQNSEAVFLFDEALLEKHIDHILQLQGKAVNAVEIPGAGERTECIIYTSGSTGHPKGVKINSRGIMNRLCWMWNKYPFHEDEVSCIKTSIGFVDHIWEIFGPLLHGIPSVMIRKKDLPDIADTIEKLHRHRVTRIVLVPSLLDELLNAGPALLSKLAQLNLWSCSGEALPYHLVRKFYDTFRSAGKKLLNIYGSTEVTADATCFDTSVDYNPYPYPHEAKNGQPVKSSISIGTPIDHVQVYILDEQLNPVAGGETGEICISGACLSSGYVGHSGDHHSFPAHPFMPGEKLYRTGDYGKIMPNGQIEYLGRKDAQVKINGYRIELAEIEHALLQVPGIRQACVVARERKTGSGKYLAGYYVTSGDDVLLNQDIIQYHLSKTLAGYMIPAILIPMNTLPLNINGKTDKRALPEPDFSLSTSYIAPATETERKICRIWQEALGLERVGITDEFFRMGGNSIMAIQVSHRMSRLLGHDVKVADIFRHRTIAALLCRDDAREEVVIPVSDKDSAVLSFAQERLWFIEQYEQGASAYHLPEIFELDAATGVEGIKYALRQVVARHGVLRSTIHQYGDHAMQQVHEAPLPIEETMVASGRLRAVLKEEISRPFNLEKEYPIRAKLYTVQPAQEDEDVKTILLINLHHIAGDGWSLDIFQRELSAYYKAYISNTQDVLLPPLEIQYKDYAAWQKKYLDGPLLDRQLAYWKEKLSGCEALQLPADFPRPNKTSYRGSIMGGVVSAAITAQLREIARNYGVTMHTVMLAGIDILLGKYSGQDDILTGSVTANRHFRQTENLIGFFVNTQVNRTKLGRSQTFGELLLQVHQEQVQAQAHQDLPFEKLVSGLGVERDASRHPLFQVMFEVQDAGGGKSVPAGYLKPFAAAGLYPVEKFDLSILIDNGGKEMTVQVSYATDLFREETINRFIHHYTHLLGLLAASPETPYSKHSLLCDEEYRQVVHQWNNTERPYPQGKTICRLFREQANSTPGNIALVFQRQQLTYKELDEKSDLLAMHIRQQYSSKTNATLQPGTLIALYLDRGPEMVIGIMAVMKAGAAYVPIDTSYPQERIDFILEDTAAAIVLTRQQLSSENQVSLPAGMVIDISLGEELYDGNCASLPEYSAVTDLAYVIYTSGTTGRPKGVMVEHAAFAQFACNFRDYLRSQCGDISFSVLSLTNYVFDIFGLEYALPLISGDRVIISSVDGVTEEEILSGSIIQQTPSSLLHLAVTHQKILSGNICLVGGEALLPAVAGKLLASFKKVFNVYGPAETVIWSSACAVNSADHPYIGKPLYNEQLYVLDDNLLPVPIGVKGELYIGGAGLARGYLNCPQLTAEKFVPNPFSTGDAMAKGYTRLYKTGDMVRWLSCGDLEFSGRRDQQVKIRGYRIEPAEITHALLRVNGIRQACVAARERTTASGTGKYLVAYYVPGDEVPSGEAIRSALSASLPAYMVPEIFMQVEALPLNANGKIDMRALPEPGVHMPKQYVAPVTGTEISICRIWQSVLGLEEVSTADDFFTIGGDSILSMQAAGRISSEVARCAVKDIFECRTIAKLAEYLDQKAEGKIVEEVIDWSSEIQLDPSIFPPPGSAAAEAPASILLTGATGFVGVHLLHGLLKQTHADIYCLVRAVDAAGAMNSLRRSMEQYGLYADDLLPRIIPVIGTLSEPLFGWTETAFDTLAAKIDAVYHNAAWVNLVYPYPLLKPANVNGTREILRFSCRHILKPVHYISTYSVFSKDAVTRFGELGELTPLDAEPGLPDGYSQSKWVAEQLVMQARERGIPANIYRLGHITGDSRTGICQSTDLLWNQVKSCIQLQAAPELDVPVDLTPVDFASNAIIHLSQKPGCRNRVFHLVNQRPLTWSRLFGHLREAGYRLEACTPEDWRQMMLTRIRHDPQNALYPFVQVLDEQEAFADPVGARFTARQTCAELNGIACPPADAALLQRYIDYFAGCGFLQPPGKY